MAHVMDADITAKKVRIVGDESYDVMSTSEALKIAEEQGLNLVLMNDPGNGEPAICKLMNYSKYLYDKHKAEKANKKSKAEMKEVRISCNCAKHDKEVKANTVARILGEGDSVKVVMPFKGRMMAHINTMGLPAMQEFKEFITCDHIVYREPMVEGNRVLMIVTPPKSK